MDDQARRLRLAIVGASGFVGTGLRQVLATDYEVMALTRSERLATQPQTEPGVIWRHCDLYSQRQIEAALAGCTYAVYLVHSMVPSARLTQAKMADMDLMLADNFARAAASVGLQRIVYVSSLLPAGLDVSQLLWSRREIEMILATHGTPVTVLRTGLVIGPGGSAPTILLQLVRRLPVLILPRSAKAHTQPIARRDLIRAIRYCLAQPETAGGTFDVGGPRPLSYREMLCQTMTVIGQRRPLLTTALLPRWLAALGVRLLSGAPTTLVGPLVESLGQEMVVVDNPVQQAIAATAMPFAAALREAITAADPSLPRWPVVERDILSLREARLVRSIQRLFLPPGVDAAWVARNYFHWLGRCCWPFIHCRLGPGTVDIGLRGSSLTLLRLRLADERSSAERQIYVIAGGLLLRPRSGYEGRLEFRALLDGRYAVAAIHDYAPALPWWLYIATQAKAHLYVMRRYQRRLARLLH